MEHVTIGKQTTPDVIFVMEGVNDCSHGFAFHIPEEVPTGSQIFEGIRKIIETGREKGSKVYVSTVMPFGCYGEAFRELADVIRQDCIGLLRAYREIGVVFLDLDVIMCIEEDINFM